MNKFLLCLHALVLWVATPGVTAHVKSEQMNRELNAKTPEWLSIGVPVKVEPVISLPNDQIVFRSRSGGATNSRNRIQIPSRGIEIKLDYNIDWTGNNEAGIGVSLSPDGKRLIVNSGPTSHLYEIEANGTYREVSLQLPHVTYDGGLKGYLREWSWADDQTLVARAEIADEAGHEVIENRFYVFHTKERALSRLDFSAFNLPTTDGLELTQVGSDLNHLKFIVGNHEFIAKADLKTPPTLEKPEARVKKTAPHAVHKQPAPKRLEVKAVTMSNKVASSIPWSILVILLVTVVGLLWLMLKKRK
jgi:hypothetical protein